MNNSFGIFSNDLEANKNTILQLAAESRKLGDVVLFTDNIDTNSFTDNAIFSSFYMRFFPGIIIFLNQEDHDNFKNIMMGKPMLFLSSELLANNNIDLTKISTEAEISASGGYS